MNSFSTFWHGVKVDRPPEVTWVYASSARVCIRGTTFWTATVLWCLRMCVSRWELSRTTQKRSSNRRQHEIYAVSRDTVTSLLYFALERNSDRSSSEMSYAVNHRLCLSSRYNNERSFVIRVVDQCTLDNVRPFVVHVVEKLLNILRSTLVWRHTHTYTNTHTNMQVQVRFVKLPASHSQFTISHRQRWYLYGGLSIIYYHSYVLVLLSVLGRVLYYFDSNSLKCFVFFKTKIVLFIATGGSRMCDRRHAKSDRMSYGTVTGSNSSDGTFDKAASNIWTIRHSDLRLS